MGSDDIESANGTPKDKVALLFGRFLVGGIGNETIFAAASLLERVDKNTIFTDGTNYIIPTSIQCLCEEVLKVLPIVSRRMSANLDVAMQEGYLSVYDGIVVKNMDGTLFMIDTKEFKIYLAEFGILYRVTEYKYKLTELEPEKPLRAGTDNPPRVMGELTQTVLSDPFLWCDQQVDEAREQVKRTNPEARIGNLGASYLVTPTGVTRKTGLFQSLEHVALKYFPDPDSQIPNDIPASSDDFQF